MQIEQHLEIPAPVDVAWDFFTDVPRMVQCIPGAESVAEIDDQHLAVRIKTRVGPISVAFDCHIAIKGLDQSAHSGSANISGRDTKIGAGVKAVTTFALAPRASTLCCAWRRTPTSPATSPTGTATGSSASARTRSWTGSARI